MCNSMRELAGTKKSIKLGGTDSQLIDPTRRRLLAKTLEQDQDTFGSFEDVDLIAHEHVR